MRGADNLSAFMCRLFRNLGASISWNPKGLSRAVMGFYLFTFIQGDLKNVRCFGCVQRKAVVRYTSSPVYIPPPKTTFQHKTSTECKFILGSPETRELYQHRQIPQPRLLITLKNGRMCLKDKQRKVYMLKIY